MWFSTICERVTDHTFGILLFSRVHNFQDIAVFSNVMDENNIIFQASIISWKLCGCFEVTTPILLYLNPYLLTPLLTSSYLLGFVDRHAQIRTCSLMLNEPSHMSWMSLTKFQLQLAKLDRQFSTLPRYQNIKYFIFVFSLPISHTSVHETHSQIIQSHEWHIMYYLRDKKWQEIPMEKLNHRLQISDNTTVLVIGMRDWKHENVTRLNK